MRTNRTPRDANTGTRSPACRPTIESDIAIESVAVHIVFTACVMYHSRVTALRDRREPFDMKWLGLRVHKPLAVQAERILPQRQAIDPQLCPKSLSGSVNKRHLTLVAL